MCCLAHVARRSRKSIRKEIIPDPVYPILLSQQAAVRHIGGEGLPRFSQHR